MQLSIIEASQSSSSLIKSQCYSLNEMSYYGLTIFVPAAETSGDKADGNEVNIYNREEPDTGKYNLQECYSC